MKKYFSIEDTTKIKGIAIIMMILHHLFRLESYSQNMNVNFFPFNITQMAELATFFKICVPIFVFLSGYGLLSSYKKLKNKNNFFLSRYLKLMPTFWAVAIISYIGTQLYNGYFIKTFFNSDIYSGFVNVLLNFSGVSGLLGTINFSDTWWYIGASFIFIFLLPIIYNFSKKYGWFNVGIAIIIIPRILFGITISTTSALPFIFAFYLGMYFEDNNMFNKISSIKINKFIKLLIYLAILFITYQIHVHYPRTILFEFHFGLVPLIIILFSYEFVINITIIKNILKILGENSYIMFLIHGLILRNVRQTIYLDRHFLIILCLFIVPTFICSYLINFLLKKIKYYNIFDKIEKSI